MIKIGHRGAMGYEPENTFRSFAKALELRVDMIELDVHLCKTGELVVIHDEKVDRTTDGYGLVSQKSLEELKKLDAGKGERIPLLEEVLDLVDRKAKINIELKGKGIAGPVFEIISKYVKEKNWDWNDFVISSFDWAELDDFHRLKPEVKIGILAEKKTEEIWLVAKRLKAFSVNLAFTEISRELVADAHELGLKVFAWTVNEPSDIEKIKSMGVGGIFSNFPDRI